MPKRHFHCRSRILSHSFVSVCFLGIKKKNQKLVLASVDVLRKIEEVPAIKYTSPILKRKTKMAQKGVTLTFFSLRIRYRALTLWIMCTMYVRVNFHTYVCWWFRPISGSVEDFLAQAVDAAKKAGEVRFYLKPKFEPFDFQWSNYLRIQLGCRLFARASMRPSMSSTKAW